VKHFELQLDALEQECGIMDTASKTAMRKLETLFDDRSRRPLEWYAERAAGRKKESQTDMGTEVTRRDSSATVCRCGAADARDATGAQSSARVLRDTDRDILWRGGPKRTPLLTSPRLAARTKRMRATLCSRWFGGRGSHKEDLCDQLSAAANNIRGPHKGSSLNGLLSTATASRQELNCVGQLMDVLVELPRGGHLNKE
jgi:hypothetical protein